MGSPFSLLIEGFNESCGVNYSRAGEPETAAEARAAGSDAAPLPGPAPASPRRARASSASESSVSSRPGSRPAPVDDRRTLVLDVVEPGRGRDCARLRGHEPELQPEGFRADADRLARHVWCGFDPAEDVDEVDRAVDLG